MKKIYFDLISWFKKLTLTLIGKIFNRINFRQIENLMESFSRVGNNTFFDRKKFSWITELESDWKKVRRELNEVLVYKHDLPNFQDIVVEQNSITQDNLWKTYFFYAYGIKVENNCRKCPETTRLIEKIPGMKTAFFSILFPRKHIPEHRGPYKGVLRYHLGLIVPQQKNDCKIRVGNDVRYWEEGKSLIFDDTYFHEVWNNTDSIRVVLFIDFIRPMYFPISILNLLIIKLFALSPYIQNAKANHKAWEKHVGQNIMK